FLLVFYTLVVAVRESFAFANEPQRIGAFQPDRAFWIVRRVGLPCRECNLIVDLYATQSGGEIAKAVKVDNHHVINVGAGQAFDGLDGQWIAAVGLGRVYFRQTDIGKLMPKVTHNRHDIHFAAGFWYVYQHHGVRTLVFL